MFQSNRLVADFPHRLGPVVERNGMLTFGGSCIVDGSGGCCPKQCCLRASAANESACLSPCPNWRIEVITCWSSVITVRTNFTSTWCKRHCPPGSATGRRWDCGTGALLPRIWTTTMRTMGKTMGRGKEHEEAPPRRGRAGWGDAAPPVGSGICTPMNQPSMTAPLGVGRPPPQMPAYIVLET
jgi:hypothetical protein